jgi:hypothetical protein
MMVGCQILEISLQHLAAQSMPQLQEVKGCQIGKHFFALDHAIHFEDKIYLMNFSILLFSCLTPILGCVSFPFCEIKVLSLDIDILQ